VSRKARLSLAGPADRPEIYRMRHEVYAQELGQHKVNTEQMLTDPLDEFNAYITAHIGSELAGFISITPPGFGRYSVEKYIARDALPVTFDGTLYELRILTVARKHRSSRLAATLLYAAFRWIEERKGKQIIAMGRTDVLSIYLKHGAKYLNHQIKSGAVTFELLEASVQQLRGFAERHHRYYEKLSREVIWELEYPFFKAECCFHGGAFFEAIGTSFDELDRKESVVNADVLDAWFPPSPKAIDAIREQLPWLMRTSPPTHSEGLRSEIARARGLAGENILPGAGSSDLIYLAFRQWLNPASRVLILDPMYGEYVHVLEKVIGCEVSRLVLSRQHQYAVNLDRLQAEIRLGYDLIVIVNPNNPTGQHIPRADLEAVLRGVPAKTRVWIDEAYLEYVGSGESMEYFASRSENAVVCKSMSKVYALSGMRAAYLCAPMHLLSELVSITPPWAVSLPAQLAAVRALQDESYYRERYRETHALRAELVDGLQQIGIREIVPGKANFVMFHLETEHPTAAAVVSELRKDEVFVRVVLLMGSEVGPRALRIAVKDRETNGRVLEALGRVLLVGE
jgi:histidinol-phosphate/aromatic aminotransferase/cobyric acid decarboxylase-like protein